MKVDFTANPERYADHLSAFNIDKLVPSYVKGSPFPGTIIRLPLRASGALSKLSAKTLKPEEIRRLLVEFVNEEIGIALLFLSHVTSVVIQEVHERRPWQLGRAKIKRATLDCSLPNTKHQEVTVSTSSRSSQTWRLVEVAFPASMSHDTLSSKLGYDVKKLLAEEKLLPTVALAIPVPLQSRSDGRLFTYLPLPLPTGFPCHIHALFALTQARQNLWNCSEKGLVHGTRDEYAVCS